VKESRVSYKSGHKVGASKRRKEKGILFYKMFIVHCAKCYFFKAIK